MAAISITAASFVPSANATYYPRGTTGVAAVTAGMAVYYDTTTATWLKARANATGTTPQGTTILGGLACHASSPGQPLIVLKADPTLTLGATVTEGTMLTVGADAAGDIAAAADLSTGEFPCYFGIMKDGGTTAKIDFENAFVTASALP